ncbi:sigma-E processing peptidase SpoIIGA [Virgibacillus sp. MSP4-1]|uniref:sigma-E processing peptidase SpoIIGA n=1 Tax=Virgibacillus sp. MSP4-1 TaxID=2700081 RepID=UPI0003A4A2A9|nr:sigma-E processing peptidase SpoIIGA [Virgibacillus sp. MSP4-1]QHS22175.1 sigma-E processing peptidase SpoIIGA [Virgibacillus sp. MSP4-1]
MALYLDAVWLLNFLIDWMILQIVHWITRSGTHRGWLIAGAFIASLLVPVNVFFPENILATLPGKIIFSFFILMSSFGFKNTKLFLKQFFTFYFVTFAIGGGLFGIYFLMGQQFQSQDGLFITYNSGYGDMISWIFVLIAFPIVWWFTRRRLDQITFDNIRFQELCPVKIRVNNQIHETTGFFDSGNHLMDPFTKKPVIICDEKVLKPFFSDKEWHAIKSCHENWSFEELPDRWISRIRMIPFQGVGGKRTFILIFKPDSLYVRYQDRDYAFDQVFIGIQFGELSSDGTYHCLLHPKMMQSSKLQASS